MSSISVIVNARLQSTRLPRKLARPFAGTTLVDIALERLNKLDFFAHRYYAVAEDELKEKVKAYPNVELLERDMASVKPGYNPHFVSYAHYKRVESEYIFLMNPCLPLVKIDTIRRAFDKVHEKWHNSYTSVVQTTDWIFDEDGNPVTNKSAEVFSTGHSQKFYKVAHAFHVFRRDFFFETGRIWNLKPHDPEMIEIGVDEAYDVDTPIEFEVTEAAYRRAHNISA